VSESVTISAGLPPLAVTIAALGLSPQLRWKACTSTGALRWCWITWFSALCPLMSQGPYGPSTSARPTNLQGRRVFRN